MTNLSSSRIGLCWLMLTITSAHADPLAGIKQDIREAYPQVQQLFIEDQDVQRTLSERSDVIILDVREPEEYAVSHSPGALLATNLEQAVDVLDGLPKTARVIAYCSVGYRSSELVSALQELGYERAYNLEGSIFEWARKGYALENAQGATEKVHPYDWWRQRYVSPARRAWSPE